MPEQQTQQTTNAANDDEFKALEKIVKLLAPLNEDARSRILNYAVSRFTPLLSFTPGTLLRSEDR